MQDVERLCQENQERRKWAEEVAAKEEAGRKPVGALPPKRDSLTMKMVGARITWALIGAAAASFSYYLALGSIDGAVVCGLTAVASICGAVYCECC